EEQRCGAAGTGNGELGASGRCEGLLEFAHAFALRELAGAHHGQYGLLFLRPECWSRHRDHRATSRFGTGWAALPAAPKTVQRRGPGKAEAAPRSSTLTTATPRAGTVIRSGSFTSQATPSNSIRLFSGRWGRLTVKVLGSGSGLCRQASFEVISTSQPD